MLEPSVTRDVHASVFLSFSSKSQALMILISVRPAPLLPNSSMVMADLHPGQNRACIHFLTFNLHLSYQNEVGKDFLCQDRLTCHLVPPQRAEVYCPRASLSPYVTIYLCYLGGGAGNWTQSLTYVSCIVFTRRQGPPEVSHLMQTSQPPSSPHKAFLLYIS